MKSQRFRQPIRRLPSLLVLVVILALAIATSGAPLAAQQVSPGVQPSSARIGDDFRSSPVMFIENAGQWPEAARFQVWGAPAGTMWLAEDAIWLTVVERLPAETSERFAPRHPDPERANVQRENVQRKAVNIKLSFVGANPHPRIEPFDRLDTKVSYFIGNDPDRWRPDVPVWGGVRYVDLYPGVDLEITSEGGQMVQRLAVQPSADLSAVRLRVEGADAVTVEGDMLRLSSAAGEATWPLLAVEGATDDAVVQSGGGQAFDVATPFASANIVPQSAVVNPELVANNPADLLYGTYFGREKIDGLAVDGLRRIYVSTFTYSATIPATPGAFDPSYNGGGDMFLARLNAAGNALEYATFVGGSQSESASSIIVDSMGRLFVAGGTSSPDFPTTVGAFDQSSNGQGNAFVVKVSAYGDSLVYSTLLGGSGDDAAYDLAIDEIGCAYVTGYTGSSDFPVTPGAFDTTFNGDYADAFVARLTASGNALYYATFLGGSKGDEGSTIAVDGAGNAYVAGSTASGNGDFPTTPGACDAGFCGLRDAFVIKLNAAGTALVYSTFLSGPPSNTGWWNGINDIAVDGAGRAYVTGATNCEGFPTTSGAFDRSYNGGLLGGGDAFVARLSAQGTGLEYSTFLGGTREESATSIYVDTVGRAHLVGGTTSADFPMAGSSYDTSIGGYDAFAVRVGATGSTLEYATFLGGTRIDNAFSIALDNLGTAYIAGMSRSPDFPTTSGAYDTTYNGTVDTPDGFIVKLAMGRVIAPPTPTPAPTPIPTYTISGRVTEAGGFTGIPGVTVWAGAARSTTTDANGNYTFTGLPAGTYTIRPEKAPYAFSPPSRTVSVPGDQTGVDFRRVAITKIQVNQVLGNTTNYVAGKDTVVQVMLSDRVPYDPANQQVVVKRNGVYITTLKPIKPAFPTQTLNFWGKMADCGNWQQGSYTFEATVNGAYRVADALQFHDRATLRILAVPVRIRVDGQDKMPSERWKSAYELIAKTFPIASDGIAYTQALSPLEARDLDLILPWNRVELWARAASLQPLLCGRFGQPDCYDLIIAVIPQVSLCVLGECIEGWTVLPPAVVAMDSPNLYSNVAHELGHLIGAEGLQPGLGDEYQSFCSAFRCSANPPPASYSGTDGRSVFCGGFHCSDPDVQAWDSWRGSKVVATQDAPYEVSGRGSLDDQLSFMGAAGAHPHDYWVTPRSYDFLFAHLLPDSAAVAAAPEAVERIATVSGWITTDGHASLNPVYYSMSLPPPTMAGPYTVEILSTQNAILASQGFDVSFTILTNPPEQVSKVPFRAEVRLPQESKMIRLMHEGTVLVETQISASAPSLSVISPVAGEIWPREGNRMIRWQGNDLDGDTLHYTVLYRQGAGNWNVLGADLMTSELTVDAAGLPGGTAAQVQVLATDGINTTTAESGLFTVGRKRPEAFITYPAEGASFMPGASFFLQGTAYDLEDGALPDSAYRWTSNRDGDLGTGASNLVILSPGAHVITLRVTDSDGNTAVKTIRLFAGDRVFLPLIWRAQ